MSADEIDENSISRNPNIKAPITIDSATFKWTKDDAPVLNNISLQVKRKKLVAIVGQVGSGKSSLLSALLGDLVKVKGHVNVNVSYNYILYYYTLNFRF